MTERSDSTASENAAPTPEADADALWKPGSPAATPTRTSTSRREVESAVQTSGAASEMGGSDSPWSSGSAAVFAAAAEPAFDLPPSSITESGDRSTATPRSSVVAGRDVVRLPSRRVRLRRWGAGALVLVAAVGAALGVRSVLTDDLTATLVPDPQRAGITETGASWSVAPLVAEPFAGADPRRLPSQLEQRWRADLAGVSATGRTRLSVLGDGVVIGVFDESTDAATEDGQPASVVVALDDDGGSERWRTPFDSEARAFQVLGDFDDVVVLERLDTDNRAVLGLSVDTGEVLWERDTNDPGVHVALEGTELVARVSFTVNARLTFIDPSSGEEVGRVPGRLFATDYLGTWYVRNASAVSKLDLRDGWNPPVPYATLWVDDTEPATVVDGRVLAIDDGVLQVLGADGEPTGVTTSGVGSEGFTGLDIGANFTQISPMAEDAFVLVGARSAFGAELDENGDAAVRWRATGTPIGSRPTDRGLSVVLATDGGGSQRVVDASTGVDITAVEIVPGSIQTLQLVGNGVVVKQAALVGFERVGLDLDGNRLWSLVGDGPLAIGSGVVVTYGASDAGVSVTAYGDPVP